MEETLENLDSPNQEEVAPESEPKELGLPADPVEVEPIEEDIADVEALKQRNQELYEQLKKAKGFKRDEKTGKWVKKETPQVVQKETTMPGDITRTELYSLVKANVPDEDTQEVLIYARSHGMTVTEALKLPEVKAILSVKQDYRRTQEAMNINNARRGAVKMTEAQIMENASKGKLPDDPVALAKARTAMQMAELKKQ